MSAKEQARTSFSRRAAEWAGWYSDTQERTLGSENLRSRHRLALELIEAAVPVPATVLDVGCGTGEMAATLMCRGYDVRGVDISAPMIDRARARWDSDRFQVGDCEHLPFDARTFDALVCLGVIEYQDRDDETLREIRRVLKPGGVAVISTPSAVSPLYLLDRAFLVAEAAVKPLYYFVKYRLRGQSIPEDSNTPDVTIRRYRRLVWLERLRAAGLDADEWMCHGWGWHRSRVGIVAEWLARKSALLRRVIERAIGPERVARATASFVRNPALSWLASEQLVRVRARSRSSSDSNRIGR